MTRPRLALIGLAVAAVAVVLWFVLRDDRSSREPKAEHSQSTETSSPRRAGGGPTSSASNDVRAELRVLPDDDPRGTLALEGQVIDADRAPVGGAVVSVDTNPPRQMITEADGSFAFTDLVGRRYVLVARAVPGIAGPVTAHLTASSDPVILQLGPASAVDVTVVDAISKQPISGATVEVRGIDTVTGSTGADGVAKIQGVVPGRHEVVGFAGGYAREHGQVIVAGNRTTATARLALRRGAPVSGRVVGPGGDPIAGATVRYQGASEWGVSADPRRDAVDTDAEGKFAFAALPAGTFRFVARSDRLAPGESEMITLDGSNERTGVVIRMDEGATVRGIVLNRAGQPVGGARVRVRVKTESMSFVEARQAWAGDDGKFEIQGLARRPLEVVALHETASSDVEELDMSKPPSERAITITLGLDGQIAGIVVDSAGEPIEGAQVSVWPDFPRPGEGGQRAVGRDSLSAFWLRGTPQELTDAGGRFIVRGLDKGRWAVRASRSTSASTGFGRGWLVEPTIAETGATDVKIVLRTDGAVKGKVAFSNGEAPDMYQVGFGWQGGLPFSNSDGSFELRDLPPRSYTVTVSGPGFDSKPVNDVVVEEGKTVDLGTITVTKGRTISGRVVTRGGEPVPDALVRAGRQLFGDGSTSKAAGGPPQARSPKETRSDEQGAFVMHGIGPGDVSIVAEHETRGRSIATYIPGSRDSINGIELVLAEFGSLAGTVRKAGQPAPEVIVNASSLTAPGVVFAVSSGPDGKFRFDRLAPDTYKVAAMIGRNPMRGFGFHPEVVTVAMEKTATVDLAIGAGVVSLAVTLRDKGGAQLNFSAVQLVAAPVTAKTARELMLSIGSADVYSAQAFSIRGGAAAFSELAAGSYTLCGIPYPIEVQGMGGTIEYMEREGDNLPIYCRQLEVAATPAEQSAEIEVQVPAFVPAPG